MNAAPLLTLLTLTPALGGLIVFGIPAGQQRLARRLALAVSGVALGLVAGIWAAFDFGSGGFQLTERYAWITALGVEYHLGLDGLSLLLVSLTAVVTPMAMAASWRIEDRAHLCFGLILLLQAGLFGTFTALDFFHWFLFWELSLIPAFFLVRLWGGGGRAEAATQFFVYTMVGSIALLLAFLALYLATGTFDFVRLAEMARAGRLVPVMAAKLGWADTSVRGLALGIFVLAFLGFAVKIPIVPFHTWLPAAYASSHPGTAMLLTGLMSKMGVYGFIRILLPIFPEQTREVLAPLLWLAVGTIVFSAGAALAQTDLRRVLAYSSINHLGYCVLGLCAFAVATGPAGAAHKTAALSGVFLQMFNHGLTAATLFWFSGLLEQRAGGMRGLDQFGGLRAAAPVFCGLMGIALFSSLGLPGLNGFAGEFLIFKGAFALVPWAAALAVPGLLLTAVFILSLLQRVFFGPLNPRWSGFEDLTTRERLLLAPAVALMGLLGLYPQVLVGMFNRTVMRMTETLF